jgi:hypothetical protein
MDFYTKGMPVQAGALVTLGNVWQPVCGFNLKNPENIHGRIVPLAGRLRNQEGLAHTPHGVSSLSRLACGASTGFETHPGM